MLKKNHFYLVIFIHKKFAKKTAWNFTTFIQLQNSLCLLSSNDELLINSKLADTLLTIMRPPHCSTLHHCGFCWKVGSWLQSWRNPTFCRLLTRKEWGHELVIGFSFMLAQLGWALVLGLARAWIWGPEIWALVWAWTWAQAWI